MAAGSLPSPEGKDRSFGEGGRRRAKGFESEERWRPCFGVIREEKALFGLVNKGGI